MFQINTVISLNKRILTPFIIFLTKQIFHPRIRFFAHFCGPQILKKPLQICVGTFEYRVQCAVLEYDIYFKTFEYSVHCTVRVQYAALEYDIV